MFESPPAPILYDGPWPSRYGFRVVTYPTTLGTTLNAYGVATPQQMAEDPKYWEDYNDKPAKASKVTGGSERCHCPQKLKFKSGYSYE